MTLKLEDSLRFQAEREAEMESNLRVLFPREDEIIGQFLASYRQGWNDCYKAARFFGVEKLD